ncbi:MAG: DUF5615 family PIN-like protein [Bacteroidota bacterium]
MKLLLDENLPRKLKKDFAEYEVFTVAEMGWSGKENGVLLALLKKESFEVFLTGDKNLQHQQNFKSYTIPVIVLNAKFLIYEDLQPLVPKIKALLTPQLKSGPHIVDPPSTS